MSENELTIIYKGKIEKFTEALSDIRIRHFDYPMANQNATYNESIKGPKQQTGQAVESKICTLHLHLVTSNADQYHLNTLDLNRFVFREEPYYIIYSRYPGLMFLVNPMPFELNRTGHATAQLSIDFEIFKGYAESRGTTKDKFGYDPALWQIGMGIPHGEELKYTFTERKISVYNASNMTITARQHHLLDITIKGIKKPHTETYKGRIGAPKIINKTTGDIFELYDVMLDTDTLVLSGVYPILNKQHVGKASNHGILTLAPGFNEFEIQGLSNFEISFDFRFLYK